MIVCMVGDFSANLDEGYKNTSHQLASVLARRHVVVRLNAKRVGRAAFWRSLAGTRPQIIHTIAQPTNASLVATRLLRQLHPRARTVISALKADTYFPGGEANRLQRALLRAARPHLVLAQSAGQVELFARLGCTARQLPNGVDLERLQPATAEERRRLRARYGLAADRPVALHVGHLHPNRNLLALAPLPGAGIQVLIAGSLYMGTDYDLIARLERAGFHVLKGYQPHVEELYRLADCYVFPPPPGNSITMPLSVLEAMACNLPVVTTRFGGLVEAFAEGRGLRFIDDPGDILPHVREALAATAPVATRRQVDGYSWGAVADRLQGYYEGLARA